MEHVAEYTTAEYVLGVALIIFTIYTLAQTALAYIFPRDTR